jgi:hypothetical protein
VLLAVFVVTRLPFFWYFPRVDLSQDSGLYLELARTMHEGKWPHFILRTPGYPLLVWLVTSFTDRWLAVIFVQNALSLLSSLFLVLSVRRLSRSLALPATLAMCGYLGSSQVLFYDISLISDSLYTNTVILSVSLLFLAFAVERAALFSFASASMALAIFVRPAGTYFMVIYALVLAYLLWNRLPRRAVLGFAAPFPALLLALCAYNYATIGQFILTAFGEANLTGATALYWEPDPRLPGPVNEALRAMPGSYERLGITKRDLDTVRNSWDADALFEVYANAYNKLVWSEGWGTGTRFGPGDYLQNRMFIRAASMMAIRRHPVLYAKYVWVNLVKFFEGIGYKFDIHASLNFRARGPLQSGAWNGEPNAGVARSAPQTPSLGPREEDRGGGASAAESVLTALEIGWQRFHGVVFQTTLWNWAYLAVGALGTVRFFRSRGRHLGAFLLLVLALLPLGASLVVSLVEVASDRYSYPTQFVCYLLVALVPLLWGASRKDLQGAGAASGTAQAP